MMDLPDMSIWDCLKLKKKLQGILSSINHYPLTHFV